jgi:stage V sporulation protein S
MKLRVSSTSIVKSVAGSLVKALATEDIVELSCIGPNAISTAVKSIATARGYLASEGRKDITATPHYSEVDTKEGFRSGISFIVKYE